MKFLTAALFSLTLIPTAALAEEHFHRPTTELEKTLDNIIINAEEEFKVDNKNRNYNIGLTRDLVESIFEAQTSAIMVNCNGQEIKGENCDLGYIPVICAKTSPANYYYSTQLENSGNAVIFVSPKEYDSSPIEYKLVNEDNEWKIDSIECPNGDEFN